MKTDRYDLLSVGRAAVDLYGTQIGTRLEDVQSFEKSLGGSPANVAVGSARLGLSSAMLTRVGDEQMGTFLRETFIAEGVDVTNVQVDPSRLTGLVLLSIRDRETFPLIFYRENCADMAIESSAIDVEHVGRARAVHLTGTHFSNPVVDAASRLVIATAKSRGARVVLDIDYRPVLWGLTGHADGEVRYVADDRVSEHFASVLPDCDLIVGTEEEIRIAGGADDVLDALRHIRSSSAATIVMKRGPLGCVVYEGAIPKRIEGGFVAEGERVEVLNVLGAGDAFLAGFLSGWIPRAPLEECCRRANACGALVVSRHACAPAMPTRIELAEYLSAKASPADRIVSANRTHRLTTRRAAPQPLWVLAFDHRAQLEALTDDVSKLRRLKDRIGDAAIKARSELNGAMGIIVDERYGRAVLDRFTSEPSWWVARPIEDSGTTLRLIGAPTVGLSLRCWPKRQIVKCLVRDPLDDDIGRNAQDATLVALERACATLGRRLMLEVLPVDASGGLVEAAAPESMARLYALGVTPTLWKLAMPDHESVWSAVDHVIRSNDPHCQGVLMLGNDRPIEELAERLHAGRDFDSCRGFAVGRSVFFQPSVRWLEGKIDDARLVEEVAERFVRLVRLQGGD